MIGLRLVSESQEDRGSCREADPGGEGERPFISVPQCTAHRRGGEWGFRARGQVMGNGSFE